MNLLRLNKEVYPVYWIPNFLDNEEIEKIIKYTESLSLENAKVGGNIQKTVKQVPRKRCITLSHKRK